MNCGNFNSPEFGGIKITTVQHCPLHLTTFANFHQVPIVDIVFGIYIIPYEEQIGNAAESNGWIPQNPSRRISKGLVSYINLRILLCSIISKQAAPASVV